MTTDEFVSALHRPQQSTILDFREKRRQARGRLKRAQQRVVRAGRAKRQFAFLSAPESVKEEQNEAASSSDEDSQGGDGNGDGDVATPSTAVVRDCSSSSQRARAPATSSSRRARPRTASSVSGGSQSARSVSGTRTQMTTGRDISRPATARGGIRSGNKDGGSKRASASSALAMVQGRPRSSVVNNTSAAPLPRGMGSKGKA